MTEQTNPKSSVSFCEWLFSHVSGRAHIRIGGEISGFDCKRKEIFVKRNGCETTWMPAREFLRNLSDSEIEWLEQLPDWNGSNEMELSMAVLVAAERAIRRFRRYKVRASNDQDSFDFGGDISGLAFAEYFTESIRGGRVVRSAV